MKKAYVPAKLRRQAPPMRNCVAGIAILRNRFLDNL